MKKSKYLFSTVAVAATLLAGCSETIDLLNNGSDNVDVQLTATSGTGIALTRAADGIYESTTGFDGGEHVQVYMKDATTTTDALYTVGSPQKDNSTGVMKSDLTAAATPMRYPAGPSGSVSLYAVYPATSTSTHTVAHDQIADANYKQSDLMYGAPLDGNGNITAVSWSSLTDKAALATTSMPNLVFRHQLIKLKVVLVKAPDVKQVTQVKMLNVKRSVSVTPSETALALGAPTTAADALGDEILIGGSESATTDQAKTYIYCCVFPAQAWDDEDFLAITADSYTTTYRLKRDSWAMGNEYTVTINLNELALGSTIDIGEWGDAVIDQTPTVVGGSLKIEEVADQTYRGTAYNLTPAVSYKGTPLTSGTDFDYSYFGTTNAGTAVILVTGKVGTDYEGKMGVCQFNILPRSLVTYSDKIDIVASNPIYNASAQTNSFTLTDNGLATGTPYEMTAADYNLVYDDGISSGTVVETTPHPVTVTGIGNYCDTRNLTWNITPRPVTITAVERELEEAVTKSNLTLSGETAFTTYVTVNAPTTTTGLLTGDYISEVTLTPATNITPSAATILDAGGNDVTSNYNITYVDGNLLSSKWVDIGLSVKWAATNVGATNEDDMGLFFAWGETLGHSRTETTYDFSKDVYRFYDKVNNVFTKYSTNTKKRLEAEDDAAVNSTDYKGGRMPTKAEAEELANVIRQVNNNNSAYTSKYKLEFISSKKAIKLTYKVNGNYIIFVHSGLWRANESTGYWDPRETGSNTYGCKLWTADLDYYYNSGDPNAYYLEFQYQPDYSYFSAHASGSQTSYYGQPVRAVKDK
jgi:hypothetical protein